MDLYSALNLIEVKKRGLTVNAFSEEIREKIEFEDEKKKYDLLKNISSLGYKIVKMG